MSRSIEWTAIAGKDGVYHPRRWLIHTSPRRVKIMDLERTRFCVDCKDRYSPLCKYCELDGTCSRHGVVFVNDKCPMCSRTFENDWNEYIEYIDKFKLH